MLRTRHTSAQMVRAEQMWLAGLSDIDGLCGGADADLTSFDLVNLLVGESVLRDWGRSVDIEIPRIAILSSGIWQLRDAIREITQMEPVRWMPPLRQPEFGCVAGWGLKRTAKRARALANKSDVAFLALEDGFIRSIHPGPDNLPVSLVVDRTGVHYDATAASDLEGLIAASAANTDAARLKRATRGLDILRRASISKYNHAPRQSERELALDSRGRHGRVLVVDQTRGDSSIAYGLASPDTFNEMLRTAQAENPSAEILVKLHPEVVSGRKQGHFTGLRDARLKLIDHDVNPWSLIEIVDKVYVVTSQLGFEAVMARKHVVCFGAPFYAGWGLTDDRQPIERRKARPTLEQLFAAVYFDYSRYVSPDSKRETTFEEAVAWIASERRRFWDASALR
jgi:capsular polysaccharide export protein